MTRPAPTLPIRAAGLGLALVLAGCGGNSNRGIESIHQPVVSRADFVFDARQTGAGLGEGEAARLSGWFDSLGLRYGDKVSVDDRAFPSPGFTAEVADVAGRYGLLLSGPAPVTAGEVADGHVRVVVSRTTATVPGCPDWRGAAAPDLTGSSTPNYGCATNSNLAAMVADPEDLVRGRVPPSSVDASASGKAIRTYRERAPTGAGGLQGQSAGGSGGSN